jgi:hypothetical protein
VGRGAVQVEVVLLDVLAVVALAVGQPEHPLLQQRVPAVPQRQRETQPLLVVADAGDAVLAHRYARDRAWSWPKYDQASPLAL